MNESPIVIDATPSPEVERIARRYLAASGPVLSFLTRLGGGLENRLEALPDSVKNRIETVTEAALSGSYKMAHSVSSAKFVPEVSTRGRTATLALSGAASGFAGLAGVPFAVSEVGFSVTVMFRSIQKVAESYGFDPKDKAVVAECIAVFASGTPLGEDDGSDLSFMSTRLLQGAAVERAVGLAVKVAGPRLATVLTQKLVARAVPVLGAFTGASTNVLYNTYYSEIAHVRFALLRLARDTGADDIDAQFAAAVAELRESPSGMKTVSST